jgi:cell division protein FtsN
MAKKQKNRRNGFAADFGDKDDDFMLADLDATRDAKEPPPVPLNRFLDDEEVIDVLLMGNEYHANHEREPVADLPLVDDDVVDSAEVGDIPDSDFDARVDFDAIPAEEDAIDRLLADAGFDGNDEWETVGGKPDAGFLDVDALQEGDGGDEESEVAADRPVIDEVDAADGFDINFDERDDIIHEAAIVNAGKNKFSLVKEDGEILPGRDEAWEPLEKEAARAEFVLDKPANPGVAGLNSGESEPENVKAWVADCENKVKKTAALTYAALGFGIVALLSAVVMGVMLSHMQTKVSKLADLMSILEEDMASISEKIPDLDAVNNESGAESLNKKINDPPRHVKKSTPSSLDGAAKSAAVNTFHDRPRVKSSALEKKKPPPAGVKKITDEKKVHAQKRLLKPLPVLAAGKNRMPAAAVKPVPVNRGNEKLRTWKLAGAGKKPPAARPLNEKKTADWAVDLTAYKNLGDAQGKAAKFSRKNIPVKVVAVTINHAKWYRLRVAGFKNKENAASYAAKIKKSLKLNSVSVSNN